jgi:hypothetical protein
MNAKTKDAINQLLDKHFTPKQIAESLGYSVNYIRQCVKKLGRQRSKSEVYKDIINQIRKYWPDIMHFQNMDEVARYWLGFILADGCLRKTHTGVPVHLHIALQTRDRQHLLKLADDFNLPHEIVKNYKNVCSVSINSRELASILCRYGIDPRSKETYKRHIPKLVDYRDYIRGLIDGDGCLYIRHDKRKKNIKPSPISRRDQLRITIAITYRSYGIEIKNIIDSVIGGTSRLTKEKHAECWRLTIFGHRAERLADWIYGNNPYRYLDRKYKQYLDWKQYVAARPENPYGYMHIIKPNDEDKFKQMWISGARMKDIKKAFNIKSMNKTIQRLNLPRHCTNNNHLFQTTCLYWMKPDDKDKFKQMWLGGVKANDIKKKFKLNSLQYTVNRLGLPARIKSNIHLFNNVITRYEHKIQLEDENNFKQMWNNGCRRQDIMNRFGITSPTVTRTAIRLGLPSRTSHNH